VVLLFFPEERYELRSLILNYSLRVMNQSQYMQDAPGSGAVTFANAA
jgi:hypothetical protein